MHLKLGAGEMESQSRPFVAAEGGRLSKSIIPQTGSHKAYVALDKEQGQEDDVNKMDFYKTQERVQGKMTFNYLVGGSSMLWHHRRRRKDRHIDCHWAFSGWRGAADQRRLPLKGACSWRQT